MLGSITILNGNVLTRSQYLEYRASLSGESEDTIKMLCRRCETGETDFPPDFPERLFDLASQICEDIKRSGGEIDPCIEEQVHSHTHAATETTAEAPLSVEEKPDTPSTEMLVVEAAREARLEGGTYNQLREVFEFSDDMTHVRTKDGAIVSPQDWGALLGFSIDLGKKSIYLMGTAANALMVSGHENAVVQLCGAFGLHHTSLYNAAKMCRLVPVEKRVGLYPSVVQEIAVRRYDKDEGKNQEIVLKMVEQAREHNWTCEEARSHANAKLGKEPKSKDEPSKKELQDKLRKVEAFLNRFLAHYVSDGGEPLNDLARDVREYFKP